MTNKTRKVLHKLFIAAIIAVVIGIIYIVVANLIVTCSTSSRMHEAEYYQTKNDYDAIIVLGCGIYDNSIPTPLMSDRLDAAIILYNNGVAPKILMSGDHREDDYNEVAVMREYAMAHGVPSEDIFMDHAGLSTYETMYRAKNVFGINKAIVVTQEYHLYRSLYLASAMGIDADGAIAVGHTFQSQWLWNSREILARSKDLLFGIFKPDTPIGGEPIDITGNGEVTLDE